MIRFACPKCRKPLSAPEDKAGCKVPCPGCGQRLQIPAPPPAKTRLGVLIPDVPDTRVQPPAAGPAATPAPAAYPEAILLDAGPVPARARGVFEGANLLQGLHNQRLAILAAAALGMLATFLPWVHVPILGAVSGARGDGWITLLFFLAPLKYSLAGNMAAPVGGIDRWFAVIGAGVASLIGLGKISAVQARVADLARDNEVAQALSGAVEIGVGLYLVVAAGAAIVIAAWALDDTRPRKGKLADLSAAAPTKRTVPGTVVASPPAGARPVRRRLLWTGIGLLALLVSGGGCGDWFVEGKAAD